MKDVIFCLTSCEDFSLTGAVRSVAYCAGLCARGSAGRGTTCGAEQLDAALKRDSVCEGNKKKAQDCAFSDFPFFEAS